MKIDFTFFKPAIATGSGNRSSRKRLVRVGQKWSMPLVLGIVFCVSSVWAAELPPYLRSLAANPNNTNLASAVSNFSLLVGSNMPLAVSNNLQTPAAEAFPASIPSPSTTSLLALSAPAPAMTNSMSMEALDDKHRLAIGDRLSFKIEEDQEESKPLVVTDSGDIEFPYIGRFAVENKTCKQLARELKAELEKEYYYRATVIVAVDFMTKSRGKVYLVGAVRLPGFQEIPSDEVLTLSKAVLRAGGFTDYADKRNVKITRSGGSPGMNKQTLVRDVGAILEDGKTELDVALQPGDMIHIPDRIFRF